MRNSNDRLIKVAMTLVSILFILFIWCNSLISGNESSRLSVYVMDFVNNVLGSLKFKIQVSNYMVRKSAHICEFLLLGVILSITLRVYTVKALNNVCNILFVGLMTAVIDEFIQLFIDGRIGEIKDVIIDFTGLLIGIFLTLLIMRIFVDKKKNKYKNRYSNKRRYD